MPRTSEVGVGERVCVVLLVTHSNFQSRAVSDARRHELEWVMTTADFHAFQQLGFARSSLTDGCRAMYSACIQCKIHL